MTAIEAALEAARLRFRPIVMTSLAFVLGVCRSRRHRRRRGARRSMGTGVFGGMIAATFIATLFVPLFFQLVTRRRSRSTDVGAGVLDQVGPNPSTPR